MHPLPVSPPSSLLEEGYLVIGTFQCAPQFLAQPLPSPGNGEAGQGVVAADMHSTHQDSEDQPSLFAWGLLPHPGTSVLILMGRGR